MLLESTLATFYKSRDKDRILYDNLIRAQKYVLGSDMSRMLFHLCQKHRSTHQYTEDSIKFSSPSGPMWIEMDNAAYVKEAKDSGAAISTDEDIFNEVGYIVFPDKGQFVCGCIFRDGKQILTLPVYMVWNPEGSVHKVREDHMLTKYNHLILGNFNVETDQVGVACSDKFDIEKILREFAGWGQRVLSFISTIMDVPTIKAQVSAPRGVMRRKDYQAYMEHTVITLTVPQKTYPKIANSIINSISRRKRHKVREHWRVYRRGSVRCEEHEWGPNVNNEIKCTKCPSWKVRIERYERGDASIGWVNHDFVVKPLE